MGVPHGGRRDDHGDAPQWEQDLVQPRPASPPGTSWGDAPHCRLLTGGPGLGGGGPRFAPAPGGCVKAWRWEGDGNGMWPEPPCLKAPSPTPAPGGPPALAGKWQRGTKAACGGRRVSALPAGRPRGQTRGPCARRRGLCQASPDPAARQHVPAARGGWRGGGERSRAPGLLPGPHCRQRRHQHLAAGPGVPQDTPGAGTRGSGLCPQLRSGAGQGRARAGGAGGDRREGTSLLQPPVPTPAVSPSLVSPFPPSTMSHGHPLQCPCSYPLQCPQAPQQGSSALAPSGREVARGGQGWPWQGHPGLPLAIDPPRQRPLSCHQHPCLIPGRARGRGPARGRGTRVPRGGCRGVPVPGDGGHAQESTGDGELGQVSFYLRRSNSGSGW